MAVDLAKHRIRVNCVAPGSVLFPGGSWDKRTKDSPELVAKMLREELPWGRFGKPEEIAEVVAFACSERASWLTGACIPVDGGQGRAL
ncbi:MAG: SDR family oxidoreductase [Myxococcales bacterium]